MSRQLTGALGALGLLCFLGCGGGSLPAPADPERGAEAIRAVMESWKRGETPEDLQKRQPPIFVNDSDWNAGVKLVDFTIIEPLEPYGRQLRCDVKLSLKNERGAVYERKIGYQVETNPALVIAREGL